MLSVAGLTYSASVAGFIGARFALGLGESGNFPGAIKTVAEKMKGERSKNRVTFYYLLAETTGTLAKLAWAPSVAA